MYPRRRTVGQALRLGLLVILVVLALSACGATVSKPQPLPEDEQVLRPGAYRSEEFKPSLTFKVGKGWTSDWEASDELHITRGEMGGLGFANVQEVYKPTGAGTPKVVDAPEDMVGWFQQHPYLQTDKPEPVTVGGVKGVQFDVVVVRDLPENHYGVCGSDCVDIWRSISGFTHSQRKDVKEHVIVLENVKSKTVIMGFGGLTTEFDEFAPEAQKVINSVKWRGS